MAISICRNAVGDKLITLVAWYVFLYIVLAGLVRLSFSLSDFEDSPEDNTITTIISVCWPITVPIILIGFLCYWFWKGFKL